MTPADPTAYKNLIALRYRQATEDYEAAKTEFSNHLATNPVQAIEWHAENMVKIQTRYTWWMMVEAMAAKLTPADLLEAIKANLEQHIDGFLSSSDSTCPWHNACRRAEAHVYSELLRMAKDLKAAIEEGLPNEEEFPSD